jgi:hypothetical protein
MKQMPSNNIVVITTREAPPLLAQASPPITLGHDIVDRKISPFHITPVLLGNDFCHHLILLGNEPVIFS